jgi:predicted amidohydrolase YtcJ
MTQLFHGKLVFLVIVISSLTSCIRSEEADLIVHNAHIITVDKDGNVYEAMAIKDGKIIELGKENQILNKYSCDNKVDAKHQTILPGFIDAHCHFLGYGLSKQQIDLKGVVSMEDMVNKFQNFLQSYTQGWLTGRGWDNSKWENQDLPNNKLLNQAFPNTPVLLRRIDGHSALVNQKALDLAGITDTTFIPGGHIEYLEGELTGILMDNAVDKILELIPEPDKEQKRNAIHIAQQACFEKGLTTVTDAGLNKDDILLLQELEKEKFLKMKMYIMISDNKENFDYFIDSIGKPITTERLNIRGVKFYGDGSLGSRSACLTKPYSDVKDSSNYGFLLQNPSYFDNKIHKIANTEFQICTHCIGDSAARLILDIYGKYLEGFNDRRWRIEHAQVISPEDFEKFRKFSIIPSVQPTHATSDMVWAVNRLGTDRIKNSYAYKDLLNQNGIIALGTDFPIENINPIETFYAAVARKNKAHEPMLGFQKENALTRWEAIKGMTIWAAMANFEENNKGSLEVGKDADFIMLSQDIMSVPEENILKTFVTATFINGEKVFGE